MVPPDPATLVEMRTRDQRTREFVATLQLTPPNDNMTDGGGEPPMFIYNAVEISSVSSSDYLGPSSNATEDC